MDHTFRTLFDPTAIVQSRQPRLVGVPGAILLGLGVVLAAGLIVPTLLVSPPDSTSRIEFVASTGALSIGTTSLSLLAVSVVFPLLYCLLHTGVLVLGTAVVDVVSTAVRDGPRSIPVPSVQTATSTFVDTSPLVAIGLLPQLLATLVTVGVFLTVLSTTGVDSGTIHLTPASHGLLYTPSLPVATAATHVVGALCTLWSGLLWIRALSVARNVSSRRAAVVVVPYVALLVYQSDLVGHLGL